MNISDNTRVCKKENQFFLQKSIIFLKNLPKAQCAALCAALKIVRQRANQQTNSSEISEISEKIKNIIATRKFLIFVAVIFLPNYTVAAAAFDVTAAGKAMFNPIITFIEAWYGTGIFAAGVGGAVVAAGDLRTRAMGFGIGSIVAGLTLLGVKAGFNVKIVSLGFAFA